jgi:hypothetical protein
MTPGQQKFNCKIELSKTNGITISIRDLSQPEQVYKQVKLEGDSLIIKTNKVDSSCTITQTEISLTTEVKNAQGSTKIEQGPEEVKVTCKVFTVDATTINLTSKEDTTCKSTGAWSLTSTKDLKLESKAKCDVKSDQAMTLKAVGAATLESDAKLQLKGATLEATSSAAMKLDSQAALELKGTAVSVKGSMRAELDSPSTTVGSTMTTVQGQIVSISGSMIKLG